MEFYDLETKTKSLDINLIFPDWKEKDERIVIFSPHDDDVILGASYALLAALHNNGKVYVIIINDGSAGYSEVELKEKIVEIRETESIEALKILDIRENHIIRYYLPDCTAIHYLGWKLPWIDEYRRKREGLFSMVLSTLREIKATRIIFPNGYREHIDHTAASLSVSFYGPQAGDSVIVDYGQPIKIKTFLQYSVWGKLSPGDALIKNRDINIRANRAIVADEQTEKKVINSLKEFKTQQEIISYILEVRKERKLQNEDKFVELYLKVDPRPRFDYLPYKKLISEIDKK